MTLSADDLLVEFGSADRDLRKRAEIDSPTVVRRPDGSVILVERGSQQTDELAVLVEFRPASSQLIHHMILKNIGHVDRQLLSVFRSLDPSKVRLDDDDKLFAEVRKS